MSVIETSREFENASWFEAAKQNNVLKLADLVDGLWNKKPLPNPINPKTNKPTTPPLRLKKEHAQKLGELAAEDLMMRYPENPELKNTWQSACNYAIRYRKEMIGTAKALISEGKINPDNFHRLKTLIAIFNESVYCLSFRLATKGKTANYEQEVFERTQTENAITIEYQWCLDWALKTLKKCFTDLDCKMAYSDVSIALAIVTGRRMVELHCTGEFGQTDNPLLMTFKGQAKTKSRKMYKSRKQKIMDPDSGVPASEWVFTIPVLCDSKWIMEGVAWLERANKRFPKGSEVTVNDKYSSLLSRKVKGGCNFLEGSDLKMTFHKYRAAYYAVLNSENFENPFFDVMEARGNQASEFAANALCDGLGMQEKYDRFIIEESIRIPE